MTNVSVMHVLLQSAKASLNTQQEKMLSQVGATVRNSSGFLERLSQLKDREMKAKLVLDRLSTHELHDLLEFYKMMATTVSQILRSRHYTNT